MARTRGLLERAVMSRSHPAFSLLALASIGWHAPLYVAVPIIVVVVGLRVLASRVRGRPPVAGKITVRCSQGHVFTTTWSPLGSLFSIRLGAAGRFQRCRGSHTTLVHSIRPRPSRTRHTLVGLASIGCAIAVAACGSSAKPGRHSINDQALAYSRCMRANGVPGYPDPNADGQTKIASSSGINFSSPGFTAAESACRKFTAGGPSASGASAQILGKYLAFSKCIRAHGITDFPDPTTSPPGPAPGRSVSTDGVYLFIPITILNSSAYQSASRACRPSSG
jgi:hypothetical protein